MKSILFSLALILGIGTGTAVESTAASEIEKSGSEKCGDGTTYSNEKQTRYEKRLSQFPKIEGVPEFIGGKAALDSLIEANLTIDEDYEGEDIIFNLNYYFIVSCEGNIAVEKTLGNPRFANTVDIEAVIKQSSGK